MLFLDSKRKRCQPSKLNQYALFSNIGIENETLNQSTEMEVYWRKTYMLIIDHVIVNLEKRFSNDTLKFAESVDHFLNLDIDNGEIFINYYKVTL